VLENYVVRYLVSQDAVDYDEHADLLYKLAGEVIARLRSYSADALKWKTYFILAAATWRIRLDADVGACINNAHGIHRKITHGFDVLRPASFTLAAGENPRNFREPIVEKRLVRQMVFKGFIKCCYPYQKFHSVEGEWRLAQILEDDTYVLKWMKPAPGQFRIEYEGGKNYEPDFVVETRDSCLLIEPKRADQVEVDEVKSAVLPFAGVRMLISTRKGTEGSGGRIF
jgi:type III restriction enzyme